MGLEEVGAAPEHPCGPRCRGGLDACNPFKFSTQSPRANDGQRGCFDLLPCLPSSTSPPHPGEPGTQSQAHQISHSTPSSHPGPTPSQLPRDRDCPSSAADRFSMVLICSVISTRECYKHHLEPRLPVYHLLFGIDINCICIRIRKPCNCGPELVLSQEAPCGSRSPRETSYSCTMQHTDYLSTQCPCNASSPWRKYHSTLL